MSEIIGLVEIIKFILGLIGIKALQVALVLTTMSTTMSKDSN